jgi:hypothetical protein
MPISCAESGRQPIKKYSDKNQPINFISLQNYTKYDARTGPIQRVVNNNIIRRI